MFHRPAIGCADLVYARIMIVSNEIHVIRNPKDAELAERAGLPPIDSDCANCGTEIGAQGAKFKPAAVILTVNRHWSLCMSCASPAIKPRN